jgi:hypothetical protein
MQPAAYAGLLGNASLLTAIYGKICVELNCAAIQCTSRVPNRVKRHDEATMTTTIQGWNKGKT